MDNSNNPLNSNDQLFSEKMPEGLKHSILSQANSELSTVRHRERIKSVSIFFGGLVTASVVGVAITRNILKQKNSQPNNLAANDSILDSNVSDSLQSELELADWNDGDFDMMANLEDFENLTEEEFNYILDPSTEGDDV